MKLSKKLNLIRRQVKFLCTYCGSELTERGRTGGTHEKGTGDQPVEEHHGDGGFNGAARRLHKGIYTALRSCVSFFLFILSDLSLRISFYLPTKSRVLRKCRPSLFRVRVHCFNMRVYQGASSFVSRVRHGHCQGQQNASLLCNRTS